MTPSRAPSLAVSLVVVSLTSRAARAEETRPAVARPGGGQPALAVGFDAGKLRARVCAAMPCTAAGGTEVPLPPDVLKLAPSSVLRTVRLGADRKAIVVEEKNPTNGTTWTTIVTAPLTGSEPLVVFNAATGFVEGIEGERSGPSVVVRDEGVYVGRVQEGRDLCGRSALLAPEALDPESLTLKPAKLMRLDGPELEHAVRLTAAKVETPAPPGLLHAGWATSAASGTSLSALTDGKPETTWAEGRGGAGRGESAVVGAPREVPIAAFEVTVPSGPATAHAEKGNASKALPPSSPHEFWLATDRELFRVTMPDDAAKSPGARYEIALPHPVQTGCVALIVESGFGDAAGATVGFAEVTARPSVSGSVDELVQRLGAPGPEGDGAAALLGAMGAPAFTAVAAAFSALTPDGQRRALGVLDEAPCEVAVPPYLVALTASEAIQDHARAVLARCGKEGPETIARTLRERDVTSRLALAEELVTAAPAAAVDAIVPLLDHASRKERRAYRAALARAAEAPDGGAALAKVLERTDLPRGTTLDVLRSPGSLLLSMGEAPRHAFSRLSTDGASFRTRFLLIGPAAQLAATDGPSRTFLRQALRSDPSPLIRSEVARSIVDARPFSAELSAALDDPDVRVREAAVTALGESHVGEALPRITYRFREDPWPLVRSAAARALAGLGPSAPADEALVHAIDYEESAMVRRAALLAVGARKIVAAAPLARDRLRDRIETDGVRSAAALALGLLCDRASIDALTEQALRLVNPNADEAERRVADAALAALSAIKPADLPKRIALLTDKHNPGAVRRLAAVALAAPGRCGGR